MGNKPAHSPPQQRPASLGLPSRPPALTLDRNNRQLASNQFSPPLEKPATSISNLKPPPNLQMNPASKLSNFVNNRPSIPARRQSSLRPLASQGKQEEEIENRILDSQSISSFHFPQNGGHEAPERQTKVESEGDELYRNTRKNAPRPVNFDNQQEGDPLEKMRAYLLRKGKRDMHLRFFISDPDLMFIIQPILSRRKKKLVPLRNLLCEKADCLYDIEDLLNKYRESMFSNYLTFLCFSCKQVLELNRFYFDITLSQIINEIFDRYNKTTIQCREVTILRTGQWEPSLPEYLKLLDRNIAKTQDKARKIASVDEAPQLKPAKIKRRIPDYKDFKNEEFKSFEGTLLKKEIKTDKKLVVFSDFAISMQDYLSLKSEASFTLSMMSFFLHFIEEYQKRNLDTFNKDNGSRTFALGLRALKFDKFYKRVKYEFIPGSINHYKRKTQSLIELFNLVALMVFVENRWIVILLDLNTFDYYPVDFLQDGLSNIALSQISDLALYLARKEFNISLKKLNVFNLPQFDFLQDFGIYCCYFLYKFMTNPEMVDVSVEIKEKNLFKRQLCWQVLKMCDFLQSTVLVFEFPMTKEEREAEEKYQRERRLLHKKRKEMEKLKEIKEKLEESASGDEASEEVLKNLNLEKNEEPKEPENKETKDKESDKRKKSKKQSEFFDIYQGDSQSQLSESQDNKDKDDQKANDSKEKNENNIVVHPPKEIKTTRINSKPQIIVNKIPSNRNSINNNPAVTNPNPEGNNNNTNSGNGSKRPSVVGNGEGIKPSIRNSIFNPNSRKSILPAETAMTRKSFLPGGSIPVEINTGPPARKSIFLRKKSTYIETPKAKDNKGEASFPSQQSLQGNGNMAGDMINLTKEEFIELMRSFKERIVKKVNEKFQAEEANLAQEDIKVEDDIIIMNKAHLKKLLEEYEEYLRTRLEDDTDEYDPNKFPQTFNYNQTKYPSNFQGNTHMNSDPNNPAMNTMNPYPDMNTNYPDPYNNYNNGNGNFEENMLNQMNEEDLLLLMGLKNMRRNEADEDEEDDDDEEDDEPKRKKKKGKKGKVSPKKAKKK